MIMHWSLGGMPETMRSGRCHLRIAKTAGPKSTPLSAIRDRDPREQSSETNSLISCGAHTVACNMPSLKKQFFRGASWKIVTLSGSASVSTIVQLALAFLLSSEEFGVYALAIASASLVQIARDGGMKTTLVRLDPASFREQARAGLLVSFIYSIAVAALLFGLAAFAGDFFGDAEIGDLIRVIAVATPLSALAPVASAGLYVGMHYRTATLLELVSAIVRHALTLAFAIGGFGPLSFVLPLPFVYAFDSGANWIALRHHGLMPNRVISNVITAAKSGFWVLGASWFALLYQQIDYLVLGRLSSTLLVGYYFFAYQLVMKVFGLIDGLRDVAVSGLALASRSSNNAQRTVQALGLNAGAAVSVLFLFLATMSEPLIHIVLTDKWSLSIGSVQALALAMPTVAFLRFVEWYVQAKGSFGTWTGIVASRTLVIGAAAAIGATWSNSDDPTTVAIWVSAAITLLFPVIVVAVGKMQGFEFSSGLRSFLAPHSFLLFSALGLIALGRLLNLQSPFLGALLMFVLSLLVTMVGFRVILRRTAQGLLDQFEGSRGSGVVVLLTGLSPGNERNQARR